MEAIIPWAGTKSSTETYAMNINLKTFDVFSNKTPFNNGSHLLLGTSAALQDYYHVTNEVVMAMNLMRLSGSVILYNWTR